MRPSRFYWSLISLFVVLLAASWVARPPEGEPLIQPVLEALLGDYPGEGLQPSAGEIGPFPLGANPKTRNWRRRFGTDSRWLAADSPAVISPEEREEAWRILQAHPGQIDELLPYLPSTPEVMQWMDRHDWKSGRVQLWLEWRGRGGVLPTRVRGASSPSQQESLFALAFVDWSAAEPLVERLEKSTAELDRVLALAVRLRHDPSDAAARESLKEWVAKGRPGAQAIACETLLWVDWPGRDQWFVSHLERPELHATGTRYPLRTMVSADPERWVPVLVEVVKTSTGARRDGAISCLLASDGEEVQRVLLPWLEDPEWSAFSSRLYFLMWLQGTSLPEAEPALLRCLREGSREERYQAVLALAGYQSEAVKLAVLDALSTENSGLEVPLIRTAISLGIFSNDELIAGLEALAERAGEGGMNAVLQGRVAPQSRRQQVAVELFRVPPPPGFLEDLAAFLRELPAESHVARNLEEVLLAWDDDDVTRLLVDRLFSLEPTDRLTREALQRRGALRQLAGPELEGWVKKGGPRGGFAAAILERPELNNSILGGRDKSACATLLASARFMEDELPLALVGGLLEGPVHEEAVTYLSSVEKPESAILLSRLEGPPVIIGKMGPGFGHLKALEEELQREVSQSSGPSEVFALFQNSWPRRGIVVRVYRETATACWWDTAYRQHRRRLSKAELASFRAVLESEKVDQQLSVRSSNDFMTRCQYLHLSKNSGRRLHLGWPWSQEPQIYRSFSGLCQGPAEVQYTADIPGLELLSSVSSLGGIVGYDERIFVLAPEFGRLGSVWTELVGDRLLAVEHCPLVSLNLECDCELFPCPLRELHESPETAPDYLVRREREGTKVVGNVEPSGRWALATPHGNSEYFRWDLESDQLFPVELPGAGDSWLWCLGFFSVHRSFLLVGKEEKGYLVNPVTGAVTTVEGEFWPLANDGHGSPRQKAGPHTYWVSRTLDGGTEVGRYSLKDFRFERVQFYPDLSFGTDRFWVAGTQLYVTHHGDLLKLPLHPKASPVTSPSGILRFADPNRWTRYE